MTELMIMNIDDAKELHHCNKTNLPVYYSIDEYREMLQDPSYLTIGCKHKDKLIGYLVGTNKANHRVFHINSFAVDKQFRRQHIGSDLMSMIEIESVKQHPQVEFLRLHVDPANEKAIAFYAKAGFGYVCTIPHYYGVLRDGYVMGKRINKVR